MVEILLSKLISYLSAKRTSFIIISNTLSTGTTNPSMHTGFKKRVGIVPEADITQLLFTFIGHIHTSLQFILLVRSIPEHTVAKSNLFIVKQKKKLPIFGILHSF